jgi:hypothetical protein
MNRMTQQQYASMAAYVRQIDKVSLTGHLSREVELRHTPKGIASTEIGTLH